jgi:hypothetical protein
VRGRGSGRGRGLIVEGFLLGEGVGVRGWVVRKGGG